ncbi:MAG: DUF1801 domain-containing protein [Rhodospirillaceae bacterium]|nr:DUF1801 domain-containing protein [Rhodospirillaceae bacterium]
MPSGLLIADLILQTIGSVLGLSQRPEEWRASTRPGDRAIEFFNLTRNFLRKEVTMPKFHKDIAFYHSKLTGPESEICGLLATEIQRGLPEAESKVWHGHPVWFLDGNPIVGYSKQKAGIRLMFWSGKDFDEDALNVRGRKFKDASIFYNEISEIKIKDLKRWLKKSKDIQWDYKNIVKRKGRLMRIQHQ